MFETGSLPWGLVFGSIGTEYFLYGKKQQHLVALLSGIGLCMFPYVATTALWMLPLSAVPMALPFVLHFDCLS
jgi:hypothetical protein